MLEWQMPVWAKLDDPEGTPTPFRKINSDEALQLLVDGGDILHLERRFIMSPSGRMNLYGAIYWFKAYAVCIMNVQSDVLTPTRFITLRIGCEHEMTATELGRCYYHYACNKCGYNYTVDSTD